MDVDWVGVRDTVSDWMPSLGVDLFENEIDDVIFSTNQFLLGVGGAGNGPLTYIIYTCQALAALFAICVGASIAYKMMVKGEGIDVFKILKILAIAFILNLWSTGYMLDALAFIPNSIGAYTKNLYEAEAVQVQDKYDKMAPLLKKRDKLVDSLEAKTGVAKEIMLSDKGQASAQSVAGADSVSKATQTVYMLDQKTTFAGLVIGFDKFMMFLSLVIFRIGWWATIFCQQLLLGMLTIFGPIQWAFSILPKWEGAWAKWLTRYLTVHFYGAMLYFVGFYILLLFDIVLSIQVENLSAIVSGNGPASYVQNAFMTAGYLLVASVVSLRCLNLVPDLAAWMIPEGDTAFSTRNFGEGVASSVKSGAMGLVKL